MGRGRAEYRFYQNCNSIATGVAIESVIATAGTGIGIGIGIGVGTSEIATATATASATEGVTETGADLQFVLHTALAALVTMFYRGRDERDRSPARDRDRDRRSEREDDDPIKRVEREAEKQRRDLDRDLRTVFVSQVTIRATRDDLEQFFGQAGKVAEVHLIRDTRTKKSKGLAYIEMDSVESVPKALALCGQLVLGLPCIVQASQAERNRDALVRLNQQNNPVEVPRLAVDNLDSKVRTTNP